MSSRSVRLVILAMALVVLALPAEADEPSGINLFGRITELIRLVFSAEVRPILESNSQAESTTETDNDESGGLLIVGG